MRLYDIISTIFFMVLGVYVIVNGWRLGFGAWKNPGPGFIAVLSGILIFFLSSLWLLMTIVGKGGIGPTKRFFSERESYKKVMLTLLGLFIFTLLLNKAGFMISTSIFMVFLLKAVEPQSWRLVIIITLIVTTVCIFVFQSWLQVQLPEGLFSLYMIKKWIYSII